MALLQDLIQQIDDTALRERILQETNKLVKQKKFGLVFEEHLPECTPLYDVPIRVGTKVALKTGYVSDIYTVVRINGDEAICDRRETHEEETFRLSDIVAIAEFGEPIYPTLKPLDKVENAPDSDLWHTLIEADNYHALQLLEYLYAEKVDCIYIDPPYNTGAKDWKYNNDYVDSSDAYRHSKWLSMMEKRLKLAKKLLNPKDSVLIVTIDEKEYLHLGCLLEEMFSEATIQMVSSVINPSGSSRSSHFSRCDEYLFFVFIGEAEVHKTYEDMLHEPKDAVEVRWDGLVRTGSARKRADRPNMFYPFFFNKSTGKFVAIGNTLPPDMERSTVEVPDDCFAVFPLVDDEERRWRLGRDSAIKAINNGYVKFGPWQPGRENRTIYYLPEGTRKSIERGDLIPTGVDGDGALTFDSYSKKMTPLSVWNRPSHGASDYGSTLLGRILPNRPFPFPKSIYAVTDTLRFIVAEKPDALVVDFFAGSGTTMHAVNLLNAEDNGKRRCILVTNNEVSEDESRTLRAHGSQPGDDEWEKLGIARYVTWPRTVCSIEGHDANGEPLRGNYIGSDAPMADGFKSNAAFFKLSFLDKTSVALGRQFSELLPVLWMKGGAVGRCPSLDADELPKTLILPQNKMAVLVDETYYAEFDEELEKHPEIKTVFIITDSEAAYRAMTRTYDGKDCYQLYRDYLDNFRINIGR